MQILLLTVGIAFVYSDDAETGYINLPGEQVFTDRSALADQNNLKSSQYQDFIRNLYRFDKENLQKYDSLFNAQAAAAP